MKGGEKEENFSEEESLSVYTEPTRDSVDSHGRSSFDVAQRVKLAKSYRRGIRQVKTNLRSFINAVEITKYFCPIEKVTVKEQELRMRMVGICGGSGHSLALIDIEQGTILRVIDDSYTYSICNCMSLSAPLRKQKLAPLICSGHQDGRIVLRDLQTGFILLHEISNIVHHGPVTACHVCEGERRTLAIAASQDKEDAYTVYMYDFSRGVLACPPKQDHSVACTCIASVSVPMGHSYVCTGSIDGFVHIYDMIGDVMRRVLSLGDNGGAVFDIDILPGAAGGVRPSLLLVGGKGQSVRCYDLDSGQPFQSLAESSRRYSSTGGVIAMEGGQPRINACYDGVELRGHKGKVNAVKGIPTVHLGCVTGGEDGYVCIWSLETASLLLKLHGDAQHHPASSYSLGSLGKPLHADEVTSISVTTNPRLFIMTGGFDQNISIIDISSSDVESHLDCHRILMGKKKKKKNNKSSDSSGVMNVTIKGEEEGKEERAYRLGTIVAKSVKANLLKPSSYESNSNHFIDTRQHRVDNDLTGSSFMEQYEAEKMKEETKKADGVGVVNPSSLAMVADYWYDDEEEEEEEEECRRGGAYNLVSGAAQMAIATSRRSTSGVPATLPSKDKRRNTVFENPFASNDPSNRNRKRQNKTLALLDHVRGGMSLKDARKVETKDDDDTVSIDSIDSEDDIDFVNAGAYRDKMRGSVTKFELFRDLKRVSEAQIRLKMKRAEKQRLKDEEMKRKMMLKYGYGINEEEEKQKEKEEEKAHETEEERRIREEAESKANIMKVMQAFDELTESSTDEEENTRELASLNGESSEPVKITRKKKNENGGKREENNRREYVNRGRANTAESAASTEMTDSVADEGRKRTSSMTSRSRANTAESAASVDVRK